ncbi:hypothetical protein DFH11DRAFT_1501434 [Phellopilus nigrolimitatus]|nr:hypothetical protein DFH11DRAFT_1501434 [Phellopilus nigrolimitatus]
MACYTYVGDVNSNLICCVCQAPFLNPTVTTTCSHTFCRDCIVRSLESQPCCPVDRSPLTLDGLKPENLLLRNMVDELIVECKYRPSGCKHTCQRQLLDVHLRESCQYVQVPCSEDGCDQASHNTDCAEQDTSCSACSETLRRSDLTQHHQQCVEMEVACVHALNGCPWMGARRSLTSHLTECAYEAIKGFFAVNEIRMTTLHDENTVLRRKLDNAEMTIHSLRRDLETARRALGPWWKLIDTPPRTPSEDATDPFATAQQMQRGQDQSRWRASNPLSPILSFSPESSPVSPTQENDAIRGGSASFSDPAFLAAYFPSASGTVQNEVPSAPPLHGASSPAQVDPQPQQQPQVHTRVAPVDRNTTLEGALCGLRGSSVALSGALDALARRTDVALTTENLRMNEEVGALRAIVHGLRMQVHALITERNGNAWGTTTTTSYYNHPPPTPHPPLVINSTTQTTKL